MIRKRVRVRVRSYLVHWHRAQAEASEVDEVYKLDSYPSAKRAWRMIAEHHGFFRLREAEAPAKPRFLPRMGTVTRGFHYAGRTQYQAQQEPLQREACHSIPFCSIPYDFHSSIRLSCLHTIRIAIGTGCTRLLNLLFPYCTRTFAFTFTYEYFATLIDDLSIRFVGAGVHSISEL